MALSTEKREFVFELGYEMMLLGMEVELIAINREGPIETIKDRFDSFRKKALDYGIELKSDFPISGTTIEIKTFIEKQSYIMWCHMGKLEYTKKQYSAGILVSHFIYFCRLLRYGEAKSFVIAEEICDKIDWDIKELLDCAEILDVDKSHLRGLLENSKDNVHSIDEEKLKRKLKILLCGGRLSIEKRGEVKRSEVDPTRVITDECWCVSLVRLPDRNAQHAFLVLEGKEDNKSKIWFADFVTKEWFDMLRPGTQDGKIRIKHLESKKSTDKLLFKCNLTLMDVGAGDRLLFSSWLITESTARRLIDNIKEEAKNPPKYHILGNNSVAALSSGKSSSNPTGHNCFTFAKKMLRDLDDVHIQLPEDSLETWIFSATSRYLIDKRLQNREWYEKPSYQMMAMFIFGLVVSTVFLKYF